MKLFDTNGSCFAVPLTAHSFFYLFPRFWIVGPILQPSVSQKYVILERCLGEPRDQELKALIEANNSIVIHESRSDPKLRLLLVKC
jgi:hypothetical protein